MIVVPDEFSRRLAEVIDALPLRPGIRVLEIGCGPGAAARAVARRIGDGHILAIDRSAPAFRQAIAGSSDEIASGRLSVRRVAVEDFALAPGERPFDIAFAIRVGALDGRHPELERQAHERIASALVPGGKLFIDGGDPLREVSLHAGGTPTRSNL
jgi:cyclopropane fatty-acyl-phospholipid synthase-like methyltransferase